MGWPIFDAKCVLVLARMKDDSDFPTLVRLKSGFNGLKVCFRTGSADLCTKTNVVAVIQHSTVVIDDSTVVLTRK